MKLGTLSRRLAVVAAAVAVAGGSTVALASGGNDPAVYKACVKSSDKTLYNVLVNPRSGPSCRNGDKVISWNEQGPRGPQGQRGPQGPQGPQGPPGASGDGLSFVISVAHERTVLDGQSALSTAECPTGYVATGGGHTLNVTFDTTEGLLVHASQPYPPTDDTTPVGWQVNVANATGESVDFTIWAICATDVPR
jgi:hypothetical protein